ncbi:chromatin associated protein KTI12 [Nemania sp. FL0031]|nr:chromatin associated protein KTI12 [Nemania sp. FL0031]
MIALIHRNPNDQTVTNFPPQKLIIVTGFPTSGKSTRAKQLHTYFSERIKAATTPSSSGGGGGGGGAPPPKYRLHLISDQTLSISRAVYDLSAAPAAHTRSANASEKDARAALYGAVKRVLSDRDIVILDGLNYIKGWRYQLHCEAKAVHTPSCVLQVGCSRERSREVNEARLSRGKNTSKDDERDNEKGKEKESTEDAEGAYEPANWENLVFRYEEPNPMTRWDSPLFTLIWEDGEEQSRRVFESMWEAVAGETRKVVKPNQATVQRSRDADGDYLYVLDRETQDIVKRILEQQGDEGGGEVRMPRGAGQDGEDLLVELPGKKIGLPQLQRLRRAFVGLNRGGIGLEGVGNLSPSRIRESFVGYLNDSFEKDG